MSIGSPKMWEGVVGANDLDGAGERQMPLSEAIKKGAKLSPQAFGDLRQTWRMRWPWSKPETRTCALGAAFAAAPPSTRLGTVTHDREGFRHTVKKGTKAEILVLPDEWLTVLSGWEKCPDCGVLSGQVQAIIPHLNDHHRWPRERIAAWVRMLEKGAPD